MASFALSKKISPAEIMVSNPFDGSLVGVVSKTSASAVNLLLERANRGAQIARLLPRHQRSAILEIGRAHV